MCVFVEVFTINNDLARLASNDCNVFVRSVECCERRRLESKEAAGKRVWRLQMIRISLAGRKRQSWKTGMPVAVR